MCGYLNNTFLFILGNWLIGGLRKGDGIDRVGVTTCSLLHCVSLLHCDSLRTIILDRLFLKEE